MNNSAASNGNKTAKLQLVTIDDHETNSWANVYFHPCGTVWVTLQGSWASELIACKFHQIHAKPEALYCMVCISMYFLIYSNIIYP